MHGSSIHVITGKPNHMQAVGPDNRLLTRQGAEAGHPRSRARGLVPLHVVPQVFRLQLALNAQHLQGSHTAAASVRCYRCHRQAVRLQTHPLGWAHSHTHGTCGVSQLLVWDPSESPQPTGKAVQVMQACGIPAHRQQATMFSGGGL